MTTTPATQALLPCPFCGTVPTLMPDDSYGHCGIGCHCEAEPFVQARKDEPEKAIAAWNTRKAHSLPGDVGTALPRLDDGLILAAMKGHYGKAGFNIDGIDLTADGTNWTFREGFKRMWAGVRKELKRRAALTPSALSGDAGEGE